MRLMEVPTAKYWWSVVQQFQWPWLHAMLDVEGLQLLKLGAPMEQVKEKHYLPWAIVSYQLEEILDKKILC